MIAKKKAVFSTKRKIESLHKDIEKLSKDIRSDTFLSLIYTADVVHRYINYKLDSRLTAFAILNALVTNGGSLTPTELSNSTFRSKFNITRVLDTLEKDGLIKREPDKIDRRSVKIVITEEGIDYVKKSLPMRKEMATEVTSCITNEQMNLLRELLYTLRKHMLKILSKNSDDIIIRKRKDVYKYQFKK
ncbi:MAG: MarR family transcriptional regulator [Deltaproteobacteria bacterium]|nr:MarR family transcriptional regulator [Deltaproteobacteria bacterium]